LGVVFQFLYVAAQTGIFSFFINYADANVSNLSDQAAGNLQTLAFGLFAGGRLIASVVVGFIKPHIMFHQPRHHDQFLIFCRQ
jgi:MFS transporter, FHS family, L-fucose permease